MIGYLLLQLIQMSQPSMISCEGESSLLLSESIKLLLHLGQQNAFISEYFMKLPIERFVFLLS